MTLDAFLLDFFQTGRVKVQRGISDLDEETALYSLTLLSEFHRTDSLTMPSVAPLFHANAALWAAIYIYRSIQLILIRDIGQEQIAVLLEDYDGADTAEEIYSVDLMLRFLPDLLKFASGISPEDPLVLRLRETAKKWPFSSVGIENIVVNAPEQLLENASLRQAYIDRIISSKDFSRVRSKQEQALLKEVLGMYGDKLVPNLPVALKEQIL